MANYSKTSPYYTTKLFENKFLDVLQYRSIPQLADDILTEITTTYDLRPDLMAYDLYGTSGLWWVFAARNPDIITDPWWGFRSGISIYLPQKQTLVEALS